jgi:uncharacterized protein
MNFGLTLRDMQTIQEILLRYPEIQTVMLFGSRAKGNFNAGSDIDLAIINEGVSEKTIQSLLSDFEDSTLPYFVDVISYATLTDSSLKAQINKTGKLLYQRTNLPTN